MKAQSGLVAIVLSAWLSAGCSKKPAPPAASKPAKAGRLVSDSMSGKTATPPPSPRRRSVASPQVESADRAGSKHLFRRPSKEAVTLTRKAHRALQKKDHPKAARLYGQALKVQPRNLAAHYHRAVSLALSGDMQGALTDLQVCLMGNYPKYRRRVHRDRRLASVRRQPHQAKLDGLLRKARQEHITAWSQAKLFFVGAQKSRAHGRKGELRGDQQVYAYLPQQDRYVAVTYHDRHQVLAFDVFDRLLVILTASRLEPDTNPADYADPAIGILDPLHPDNPYCHSADGRNPYFLSTDPEPPPGAAPRRSRTRPPQKGPQAREASKASKAPGVPARRRPTRPIAGKPPGSPDARPASDTPPATPKKRGFSAFGVEVFRNGYATVGLESADSNKARTKDGVFYKNKFHLAELMPYLKDEALRKKLFKIRERGDAGRATLLVKVRRCGVKVRSPYWARRVGKKLTYTIGGKSVKLPCAGQIWKSPRDDRAVFKPYRSCANKTPAMQGLYLVTKEGKLALIDKEKNSRSSKLRWISNTSFVTQRAGRLYYVETAPLKARFLAPPHAFLRGHAPRLSKCD